MTDSGQSREHESVRKESADSAPATLAWVAVVIAIVGTIGLAASIAVALATDLKLGLTENSAWINVVAGPTFPLVAALILRTRGRDPDRPPRVDRLAWVLIAVGALCSGTAVVHVTAQLALEHSTPGATAVAWVSSWLWTGVAPGVLLALLWFPTGDVPGPRWRWAARAVAVACTGMWLSVAFAAGPMSDFDSKPPNPLGWKAGHAVIGAAGAVGFTTLTLLFFATVASVAVRFRRGDAATRTQLRWLLIAVLVFAVTVVTPGEGWLRPAVFAVNLAATFLLPLTLAVAITRRDGYGLPRVLVYGLLSTVLLAGYVAIVGIAQAVFGGVADRVATLVAAAGVALAAAPLRMRLQRGVDKLVYGDRGDPYAALSDLGRRIAGSPDDLLHEVVGAVADALRAPYAAVVLTGDTTPAAAVGRARSPEVVVPLSLRGEPVGALVVAQRSPADRYGERDIALLDDLARHIAVAAHAAALTRDLQRSRESLVLAREEERRRIRRDLHDGLGPALAGVAFGLDAARNTIDRDPEAAAEALAQLKSEVQTSIADVRRLVYDLRPPALDQLGLVPALEEFAARLTERGGMSVSVSASGLPSPLPAAVEVAAYRIAAEAVSNAARHSGGRSVSVSLFTAGSPGSSQASRRSADGPALRIEVVDDGVGVPAQAGEQRRGVGLTAMAERAAELGGTCVVGRAEGGLGTVVIATLPLHASDETAASAAQASEVVG